MNDAQRMHCWIDICLKWAPGSAERWNPEWQAMEDEGDPIVRLTWLDEIPDDVETVEGCTFIPAPDWLIQNPINGN